MSRFRSWYVAEQLRQMGWPKEKGTFRKQAYVETALVDAAVEQSVRVCVGLGAGRPQLALAVLADTFPNNPWTETSVGELLGVLGQGEDTIARNRELLPWQALIAAHRIAPYGNHLPAEKLNDADLNTIWDSVSARGTLWGLTHESDMPRVFAEDKERYEQTAREAVTLGLDVSPQFPWTTLDQFYDGCEEFVRLFELVRPPLPEVPTMLSTAPEIARRLISRVPS